MSKGTYTGKPGDLMPGRGFISPKAGQPDIPGATSYPDSAQDGGFPVMAVLGIVALGAVGFFLMRRKPRR